MIFFWRDRRHAISKEKLEMPPDQGGLGLVNIRNKSTVQRVRYIQRLLNQEAIGNWKTLVMLELGKYTKLELGIDILKCQLTNYHGNYADMSAFSATALTRGIG